MSDDPTVPRFDFFFPQVSTSLPYDCDGNNDYTFNIVPDYTPANYHDSLGQTFTPGNSNFGSNPSSTYSSPACHSLGDSFDASSSDDWSPSSPTPSEPEPWPQYAQFLSVPRSTRGRSESGGSSNSSVDSSTLAQYPGLRRQNSAISLGMGQSNQQILDMSQNVGLLSLEDSQPWRNMGPQGRGGLEPSLSSGPSLHPGSRAVVIPIQTPIGNPPYHWPPAPSPGSSSPNFQCSSLTPIDAMAGNDNVNAGTRSKKSVQASLNRRKSSAPGKFVCHICRDDFTTKHRLNGHIASKHEGKKLTCPSCNMVLSHGTSYDRHLKRTCPVRNPRDRQT